MKKKHDTYKIWNGQEVLEVTELPKDFDGLVLKFSGFYDKDGAAIFESDILELIPLRQDMQKIKGTVEFDEALGTFFIRHGVYLTKLDFEWYNVSVVGNAFQA